MEGPKMVSRDLVPMMHDRAKLLDEKPLDLAAPNETDLSLGRALLDPLIQMLLGDVRFSFRSRHHRSESMSAKGHAPICPSFDDFVGKLLQVRWHFDTDCRRSFEVDHDIELLRPLYR